MLRKDKRDLVGAKCVIHISVGQEYHEGEKFAATLELINATFRECTIIEKLYIEDETYRQACKSTIDKYHGLDNGAEGVKKLIAAQKKAFPDWHITVDYWIQQGNKHIVKWTLEGTHTGEYCGILPSGKHFKISGVDIETIVDGKITEHDGAEDMLFLLQQIGSVKEFIISENTASAKLSKL